jgi:LuxR family maltose regulon positive regulatory protein
MPTPILATKLYIPPPRLKVVLYPRLTERLNEGQEGRLTLKSAPAGFGKTKLVSEWLAGCQQPVACLSLDEGDNGPTRFLPYIIATLQTIAANIGEGVLGVLQSPQPLSTESILTSLLNEINAISDNSVLVLDDYHVIDSKPVGNALTFLIEHQPSQMHLFFDSREDSHLPLARLRARDQLTELRAADLRVTVKAKTVELRRKANYDHPLHHRTDNQYARRRSASSAAPQLVSSRHACGHQRDRFQSVRRQRSCTGTEVRQADTEAL